MRNLASERYPLTAAMIAQTKLQIAMNAIGNPSTKSGTNQTGSSEVEDITGIVAKSPSHGAAAIGRQVCILRRMARMQVYLPDEMYEQVKAHSLPASELLQKAVRAELRRMELLAETDRYIADLVAEVGLPSAEEQARATAVARRLVRRPVRKAG